MRDSSFVVVFWSGLGFFFLCVCLFFFLFFFFFVGRASGLRQPVHAEDVAAACLAAMNAEKVLCGAYNLSGGEILRYRDMVMKIFAAMGRRPLLFSIPLWMFRVAVKCLRGGPRGRRGAGAGAGRGGRGGGGD